LPTLREQQGLLKGKQHLLAVWEVLYQYLDTTYIHRDGRPPEKAIKVKDCINPLVDEETIEEVLSNIGEGPIKELKKQIEDIENMDVLIVEKKNG
jgi:hypothetical protein